MVALASAATGAAAQSPRETAAIESAYSPRNGRWEIAWPERVSQHDIIYLSPPEDPTLGLPLGNGDLGALLWTTDTQVIVAINKCDAWDDDAPQAFHNWGAEEEERRTTLRHCGRLVVDFGCPIFDLLYQQDFEARVGLASATALLRAATPFGKTAARGYISAEHRVLVLNVASHGAEPIAPRVLLERWGSRTFAHWYSQVDRDATRGLDGTSTEVQRGRIVIQQKLRTMSIAVAMQVVVSGSTAEPRRLHSRAGAVELPPVSEGSFTVYVTAVTSENDPNPVAAAHRTLDAAITSGEKAIYEQHCEAWKRFWSASMVDIPEKYLENIWHVNLYLANSSSRGAYPPHFCNGLWGWSRDFVPWNYYFHWNMQWYAWPLAAANHAELAAPYYRLRRAQLSHALEYASQRMKKPGAFYADVSDRRGFNDKGVDSNHTPGAQIALDFWRQYAYTSDKRFLRELAWPVILEVARFNSACLVAGPDGLYHVNGTSAYEGSPNFDDSITDLAMIRALLPVAIRAGKAVGHDAAEVAQWEKQLSALAPFHLSALEDFEFEHQGQGLVHRGGLTPGKTLASTKVFAVGRNGKGDWVRNRFAGDAEKAYYGIPDPELAPVFPAGLIGLAQRRSELFQAAVTQLRLHPSTQPPEGQTAATMAGSGEICMGWCPYPIALARLGMAEELAAELVNSVSTWQFYPQGFGHYGPYGVFKPDQDERWRVNIARDAATVRPGSEPAKFPVPTWPFRHFDNEAMPIVSCAINEMLLQSHDGAVRVCPAVPPGWTVRFDLVATGGFRVSAEHVQGKTLWVALKSRLGGVCRVVHPWPSEPAIVCLDITPSAEPRPVPVTEETSEADRVLLWQAEAGHHYLLMRSRAAVDNWKVVEQKPSLRTGPRHLKRAILGRDRMY